MEATTKILESVTIQTWTGKETRKIEIDTRSYTRVNCAPPGSAM